MNKNTYRLLILLVVIFLLSGVILFQNMFYSFFTQNPTKPFQNIKRSDVSALVIQGDKNQTELSRKQDLWTVKKDGVEYQADQQRINTMIDAVISLEKGEVISNNKNKHADLGIGFKKIDLKFKDNTFTLYIGNVSGTSNNYVRIGNGNEVFIASGFNDIFSPEDYRDLSVHFVNNEDQVNQIEIAFDNSTLDLVKKNTDWYSGETKLIKERMDFFLNDLKTLKASDIFVQDPTENTYVPESLKITLKEGNENKAAIFYLKDTDTILKTSVSNLFFKIDNVYVSTFKKQEKDFTQ